MSKKQKLTIEEKQLQAKVRINSFAKFITFIVVLHGMLCVTASYVIAYLDHNPVENLSVTIVTQIMAPTITYIISNLLMNVFEKNQLSFSTPIAAIESGIVQPPSSSTEEFFEDDNAFIDDNSSLPSLDEFEFGGGSGRGNDE